jgi:hypothetical protein
MAEHLPDSDRFVSLVLQSEVGKVFDDRHVEIHFALLDELHDRGRNERLGDRSHVEQRLRCDRVVLAIDVSQAESGGVDDLLIANYSDGKAWNFLLSHHLLDHWLKLERERVFSLSEGRLGESCYHDSESADDDSSHTIHLGFVFLNSEIRVNVPAVRSFNLHACLSTGEAIGRSGDAQSIAVLSAFLVNQPMSGSCDLSFEGKV